MKHVHGLTVLGICLADFFGAKERASSNISLFTGLIYALLKSRCVAVLFVQFRNVRLEK